MRYQIAGAALSIALLPMPALANGALTIMSPIGIGMLIAAAVIGFGIGKFIK